MRQGGNGSENYRGQCSGRLCTGRRYNEERRARENRRRAVRSPWSSQGQLMRALLSKNSAWLIAAFTVAS